MLIGKSVVLPSHVRTNVIASLYISLMRVMYLIGTLCFSKDPHMTFLGTLSYASSRSMKTMCKSFFCSLYLSINCRIKKIASMVDLPGMNPNWFWVTFVTLLRRCSITLSQSFIVWLVSLIPR
ncbi:hypothetical protein PVAP13_1KG506126 [Panicum virgatum]|uniref:Uncharacterized protein n=1 Tax=Panicum virgatum TaxID=38727 RepID=A0A8T0XWG5_PANVG|nr:hypothetical protein PVAP13_1KG506126 [Panicum virgatum]